VNSRPHLEWRKIVEILKDLNHVGIFPAAVIGMRCEIGIYQPSNMDSRYISLIFVQFGHVLCDGDDSVAVTIKMKYDSGP
jgi:hypothetical protein